MSEENGGRLRQLSQWLDNWLWPAFYDKRKGFVLLLFDFGAPNNSADYVSNAESSGMILLLRKTADRLEARQDKQRACRMCGFTAGDCIQCIEAQNHPCHWAEDDLCTRCAAAKEIERCIGTPRLPLPWGKDLGGVR